MEAVAIHGDKDQEERTWALDCSKAGSKDVPPGEFVLGSPAMPKREFAVGLTVPRTVEKLKARIAELETRLAALEKRNTPPA